ncbi:MAG TPA: sigma-70 family RNA polymerase sigma factor [Candidatus Paceibacterota bacterium]|nr:sigma-70 family RNA polymerase sigma factor [Candidatus Paceibacterota bacterium]
MAKGNGRSDPERHKLETEMVACMPRLRAFAVSKTGSVVRGDDLVQQTMVQALAKLNQFKPDTNMAAWLFTIMKNRLNSDYRKSKREKEWDPALEDKLMFSTGLGDGGAEVSFDFKRLLLCLVCLPADQSDTIIAVAYLGMTYEEAAEIFHCAVGTIKSRLNRARTDLLGLMEGAVLKSVKLETLKTATKGIPQNHPYYPIAKAYEELYAGLEDVDDGSHSGQKSNRHTKPSKSDKLWEDLIASGALDHDNDTLDDLMRGGPEE